MTRVSDSEVLQIVCGAPNVKAGQKVSRCKTWYSNASGAIIWAENYAEWLVTECFAQHVN